MISHLCTTVLLISLAVVQARASVCRDAVAPPTKPRGVNQVSRNEERPIFQLHLKAIKPELGVRSSPQTAYRVSISIEDGIPLQFSQATLAVSAVTEEGKGRNCGTGEFEFPKGDYQDIVQDQDEEEECPRLLQTTRRHHKVALMSELAPLVWTPPSCGCIQMRILILDSTEVYYAENNGVYSGHLAKTVCIPSPRQPNQKISRERRLESLCHVIDKHSSSEIISRSQFQRHRDLQAHRMDHLGLEMALELRRSDAMTCCSIRQAEAMTRCFEDTRRRRIDLFCQDGTPDIPFKSFRRDHMKKQESNCCYILGEFRYKCFDKNNQQVTPGKDSSLLDYSMDASDIVNDLADFGSHEYFDEMLRPSNPDDDDDNDDNDDNDDDDDDDDIDDTNAEELQSIDMDEMSEEIELETNVEVEDMSSSVLEVKQKPNSGFKSKTPKEIVVGRKQEQHKPIYSSQMTPRKYSVRKSKSKIVSTKQNGLIEMKKYKQSRKSTGGSKSREEQNSSRKQGRRIKLMKGKRRGSSERMRKNRRKPKLNGKDLVLSRISGFDKKKKAMSRGSSRGGGRRPMRTEDLVAPNQYGFEDQGGSSMDRTMKKLKRKMKRIKLRNKCCKAGVDTGLDVYGGIQQVTAECRHGSHKYTNGLKKMGAKNRNRCADQFVDCCQEEAKKGLTMTSTEFAENSRFSYWDDSDKQYDPTLMHKLLSQRGRKQQPITTNTRLRSEPTQPLDNINTGRNFDQAGAETLDDRSKISIIPEPTIINGRKYNNNELVRGEVEENLAVVPVLKKVIYVKVPDLRNNPAESTMLAKLSPSEIRSEDIIETSSKLEQKDQKSAFSKLNKLQIRDNDNNIRKTKTSRQNNSPKSSQDRYPVVNASSRMLSALDSQEMSERNTRKYKMDALDSTEMADQYINRNNRRSGSRSGSWRRTMRGLAPPRLENKWRRRFG